MGLSVVDKLASRTCWWVLRNESRISKGISRNQTAGAAGFDVKELTLDHISSW